jgi:MFS family permease
MTGLFFIVSINSSVMNQFLLLNDGYTPADLANTHLVIPVAMVSYVFFGWLSDHIGRKRALYIGGGLMAVFYPVIITLVGSNTVRGWWNLTLLALAALVLTVMPFGVLPAYINERFATTVRSTGWGVAYGTAVIIPSFFSYYMVWLSAVVPYLYTAGILAAFGAILIVVATAFGPETQGIDLRKAGEDADREDVPPPVHPAPSLAAAAEEK